VRRRSKEAKKQRSNEKRDGNTEVTEGRTQSSQRGGKREAAE
jgi:hypothetical protein